MSIYLDLVRFLAAVCVVLYHSWPRLFPESHIKWPGHEAVVVFFVLSGYVIAHAAMRPGMTTAVYAQHRIARIVPVAWLALLLGIALTLVLPEPMTLRALAGSTIANMLFVAQSGWAFIDAPHNPPFWSLNYEVWYYVIFGCWLFARGWRRTVLTALAIIVAGPKIMLLFPVWLYGVWLYRRMPQFQPRTAWIVFVLTLVAGALGTWLNISDLLRSALYAAFPPAWHLHYSTQFLYDLLLGVAVALNFAAVASLAPGLSVPPKLASGIRSLASYTFSLYVFHSLLGVLLVSCLHVTAPLPFYVALGFGTVVLAWLTEKRTHWYRSLLVAGLGRKSARLPG
ncbi:MAG: acyltransferase [Pseudomonadota bacterium]|nr:acyltransferase [Pseudomonadota bacterium]